MLVSFKKKKEEKRIVTNHLYRQTKPKKLSQYVNNGMQLVKQPFDIVNKNLQSHHQNHIIHKVTNYGCLDFCFSYTPFLSS